MNCINLHSAEWQDTKRTGRHTRKRFWPIHRQAYYAEAANRIYKIKLRKDGLRSNSSVWFFLNATNGCLTTTATFGCIE
jgi:hypothetical protein